MRRFDFWSDGNIEEHTYGKYVLYEDVIKIIKKHEKEILNKQNKRSAK